MSIRWSAKSSIPCDASRSRTCPRAWPQPHARRSNDCAVSAASGRRRARSAAMWTGSSTCPGAHATDGPAEIDLGAVETAMNDALLGLDEQKDRLLDHLAVAKLRGDLRGPIPCIVGPPDVGKASLVAAVARGLGRPLARIELGGRGEAQLIGTRRTRAGAQPGKIVGAARRGCATRSWCSRRWMRSARQGRGRPHRGDGGSARLGEPRGLRRSLHRPPRRYHRCHVRRRRAGLLSRARATCAS
jgi:hypothetical protein